MQKVTTQQMSTQEKAIPEVLGETSIIIQAPAQMLYDYLSDLARHSEWVENLSKVSQVTPGPVGIGTRYRAQEGAPPVAPLQKIQMIFFFIVGLITGTKSESEAEIIALEPGKRIVWQAGLRKGKGWFNRAKWELILDSQGEATRVTQRFHYTPQNRTSARMIGAAGAEGIAQACQVSLQRLTVIVEGRTRPTR